MRALELWGGPECTVNRVGEGFTDQFALSGHEHRIDDLDRFASLGITALRTPLLWERVERIGWEWHDERMARISALGMRPIAGLIHHGSGPAHTALTDDSGFAAGLAAHAAEAARRYPHVRNWTPVNEPLTTARFSALYGLWFPHAQDEVAFYRALLNQIDATRLSMRQIRRIIPGARLVQTEDLGRTFATSTLARQARHDNLRRWLTWDLLCGLVRPGHRLYRRIAAHGLGERLDAIAADPCPPDIIGINHYLTSDRFLDHRTHRYPDQPAGGNDKQRYVDVEAIRILDPAPSGLTGVIREAWQRYRRPIAITELHNGCTREEQMRWFAQGWATAKHMRAAGVDIRAVTAWSLLGSHGWDRLLTGPGNYEAGVWDARAEPPRETAMAGMLRTIASGAAPQLPDGKGWWERKERLVYPPETLASRRVAAPRFDRSRPPSDSRPLLIVGASGTLGKALAHSAAERDLPFLLTGRRQLDLADERSVARALDEIRPWAVINAAGWVRVDAAEDEQEACLAANHQGAVTLASAAADRGIASCTMSSDLVFGGDAGRAYSEDDAPAPLNVYGHSKARAEADIGALPGRHLVARTAAFFGHRDEHNFAVHAARTIAAGDRFTAASDLTVSPTYVPDLARALIDLMIDGEDGIWHLANRGEASWADFACQVADSLGLDAGLIDPVPAASFGWAARRPAHVPLVSGRGAPMPELGHALARFAAAFRQGETFAAGCRDRQRAVA